MLEMGIRNGADLEQIEERELVSLFGKVGRYYHQISRGIDERPVNPNRIRKSIGVERTFEEDLLEKEDIEGQVARMADILFERVNKSNASGKTITLKVKFADFETITRSKTIEQNISESVIIREMGLELAQKIMPPPKGVRLLGLTLSNLASQGQGQNASKIQAKGQLTLEF